MGNKEQLLEGAKRCLEDKGYSRTTARDIAEAAGTSLAAIGYHFGSTEALLNQALFEAVGEWGERMRAQLAQAADAVTPQARFEAVWTAMAASFPNERWLWSTQFEVIGQVDRMPQIQEFFAQAQRQGREGLIRLLRGSDESGDERSARLVGAVHQALLAGMVTQWLVDPDRALEPSELAEALRLAATSLDPE